MKNKKRKKHNRLPAKAIIEAANGNPIAIEQALEHFKAYMLFLSTKYVTDEYGTTYSIIDQEAYRQLEIKFNYRYCNKI